MISAPNVTIPVSRFVPIAGPWKYDGPCHRRWIYLRSLVGLTNRLGDVHINPPALAIQGRGPLILVFIQQHPKKEIHSTSRDSVYIV